MKLSLTVPILSIFIFHNSLSPAQTLSLKEALSRGVANYGSVKARQNYAEASKASVQQSRRDYLPNLVIAAQQDYGTVNGQNGPLYGFGGYGVASSGLPLSSQNWNAAYGALYLANVNWEFFTFGRALGRIKVAQSIAARDQNDALQEQFQHQVRVAAAYLNLLAAQRLVLSQQKNLDRAAVIKSNTSVRAANGLAPGVDSSLAAAEVAGARMALVRARDAMQEQGSRLAVLMGETGTEYVLDSAFVSRIPNGLLNDGPASSQPGAQHPVLAYYASRLLVGQEQEKLFRKSYFPSLSLFGVFQERGSGFDAAYTLDQTAFTTDYATGIKPVRSNYLLGVGLTWNLTTIVRNGAQVKSQRFIAAGLQNEYELAQQQLKAQQNLAEQKIGNALENYNQVPVQVKAATEAYQQKTVLYKNGLATLVEVTQALYALNRAETDRDIAYANVWQALLLRAAAAGDITLFTNELN